MEDTAILKVLQVQKDAGLEIFSDGEYRRGIYSGSLADSVEGMVPNSDDQWANMASAWSGPDTSLAVEALEEVRPHQMAAGARLQLKRRLAGTEAAFLKAHAPDAWKMTITPPVARQIWKQGLSDQFYSSPEELQAQLTKMYRDEIDALIDDGASYVQLDSLGYVIGLADPARREQMAASGVDPNAVLMGNITMDNALIDGLKRDGVTFGVHMCRGNNRSSWLAEGGYDFAAEKAFSELKADRFLLEYDSDRAGGFEPLRFVAKDKMVALGLISTKVPKLESQDDLLRRIDEASKFVPM